MIGIQRMVNACQCSCVRRFLFGFKQQAEFIFDPAYGVNAQPGLSEHFGDQAKLQAFVQTYQPSQWLPTLQVMYDSIRAPQPAKPAVQPLRSRPSSLGVPASSGSSPMERVAAALDKMSI